MTVDVDDPRRRVRLDGAHNFRDLGGYRTADGRMVPWRRVFRSDALQELTPRDLERLADIGITTVVDLRTAAEVTREGRAPDAMAARYLHHSVLKEEGTESQAAPRGDVALRYRWYLEESPEVVATVLGLFAADHHHPLVFHCAAGKDRTGVVAALVLECLGVDRPTVVADYVATQPAMPAIIERLRRTRPDLVPDEVPPTAYAVRATAIEGFLASLDEEYGGASGWAASVGLGSAFLEELRANLLVPDEG